MKLLENNDLIQKEYDKLSVSEKRLVHDLFNSETNTFSEKYKKYASVVFKAPPPTPEEFLDWRNGWLPKDFSESVFEWVKQDFIEMVSGKKKYSQIVLYGCTRQGKSFCAILLIAYIIVYVHHLRDLSRFYNLAGGTSLSVYIMSFNYAKVYQLYLQPLYSLLEQSDRFVQVKFQDQVKRDQEKYGCSKIVYSKASLVGHITLSSNLKVVSGNSDALSIIGNNILAGIISEIAFFVENDGTTEEQIFRLYSDLVERIRATVGKSYLSFAFLDTSANDSESLIENYILKTLRYQEDILFRWRRRWDIPELVRKFYPIYQSTKETFPVCVGDGNTPAKIVENIRELQTIPEAIIEHVPIDAKEDFERNLIKSIKDIAGRPTTNESKLIQKNSIIDDIFCDELLNVEGGIVCDAGRSPEKLVLDQIYDKFFVSFFGNQSVIRRAPKEPRYGAADLSFSVKGDVTGLSIGHKEWSRELNKVIFVSDFSFAILPGDNGINIESVGYFVKELKECGVNFVNFVFDTFQSEQLSQFLTRHYIPNNKHSVDSTINPYMTMYSLLISKQIRSGKNIFLRNNLKSLYRIRKNKGAEKIDHSLGKLEYNYFGDWETSRCGFNAKDVSDSLCNWVYIASQDNYLPTTVWEEENEKFRRINDPNNISDGKVIEKNFKKLLKF